MWGTSYILSQVCVCFALMFLGATYLLKDKVKILVFNVLATCCFSLEYMFLLQWSVVITNMVSMCSNFWFFLNDKFNVKHRLPSLIIALTGVLVGGILTFGAWYSIISIVATLLFVYAVWQKNIKVYRWLATITNLLWIVFNSLCMSIVGTIAEIILGVVAVVGLIDIYVNKKEKVKS